MFQTMPQADTLSSRFWDLVAPLQLLLLSFLALPGTILSDPLLILHPKSLQSAWFGRVWRTLGPQMALSPEQIPYISNLFGRARGVVLELGPGSGDQMRHFANGVRERRVTRVVGAEPNAVLHGRLRDNARAVGLDPEKGSYVVLEAGAEPGTLIPALHRAGLYPDSFNSGSGAGGDGVFDTIICIKSMCSASQSQMPQILTTIQTLLKPGGEFVFFEHVANDTDPLAMGWAWLLGWLWPVCMGGCHLNGRVDKVVGQIGGWSSVDVKNTTEFRGWNVLRYVVGVCRK